MSMLGVSLRDHEDLKVRPRVTDVIYQVASNGTGLDRMADERWIRRLLEWRPRADKINKGLLITISKE